MDKIPAHPAPSFRLSPYACPLNSQILGSSRSPHISRAVSALAASPSPCQSKCEIHPLHHLTLLYTNTHFTFTNHMIDLSNTTKQQGVAGIGHVRWYTIFYLTNNALPLSISLFYYLLPLETKKANLSSLLVVSLFIPRSLSNNISQIQSSIKR